MYAKSNRREKFHRIKRVYPSGKKGQFYKTLLFETVNSF